MIPRLYSKDQDPDASNGYGFLNGCSSCITTEERNGEYYAELKVLPRDRLYAAIIPGMLIKLKANHKDPPQVFEITNNPVDKTGVMKITANHIKSYFYNNYTRPSYFATRNYRLSGTAAEVVAALAANPLLLRNQNVSISGFDNTEKELDIDFSSPVSFEDVYLGDGGFIDTFGGEFHYDNDNIEILASRGSDFDKIVRYGSGISDYSQEMNNNGVYTQLYGYAKLSDNNGNLYVLDNRIDTGAGSDLFYQRVLVKDYTDAFSSKNYDPSDYQTQELIKRKIYTKLLNYKTAKLAQLTEPSVNIRITLNAELMKLKNIGLCDTVKVLYSSTGAVVRKKVIKTVYDGLNEKYVEMEMGDKRISLSSFLKKSNWR